MSRRAVSSATVPGQSGPVGDVPVEIAFNGTLYDRLGIDEEGSGYFVAEAGGHYLVLETDPGGEAQEPTRIPPDRLRGLIEHVEENVGWRELEDGWREQAEETLQAVRENRGVDDGAR